MSQNQRATYMDLRQSYLDMSDGSVWSTERQNSLRDGIKTMAKMKQRGIALDIASFHNHDSCQPRQLRSLERALEQKIQLGPSHYSSSITESILRCVLDNKCVLNELKLLGLTELENLSPFSRLETDYPTDRLDCISLVRTLEMNLYVSYNFTPNGIEAAKSLFAALPNLKLLRLQTNEKGNLGSSYNWNYTEFAKALTTSFMPKLQSVDFKMSFPHRHELARFLQRHIHTLLEIYLNGDRVEHGGVQGLGSELQEFAVKAGVANLKVEIN